jgi:hypothetical protein
MYRSAVLACVAVAAVIAGASASADNGNGNGNGPPPWAAGPAFGYVPSQNVDNSQNEAKARPRPRASNLVFHGGPVQSSGSEVHPIYWGPAWSSSYSATQTGLDRFYQGVGGSAYAKSNTEYADGSGNHVSPAVTPSAGLNDTTAAASGAPSTTQVLAEVAKMTNNDPVAGAYYPVYSDRPRGNAGYCAWHSSGTINGTQVQFGFFFSLAGDAGCDPQDTTTGHSQQLAALANVSGHELSEMMTDPQLNAWYDQQGAENSDKCAWTFDGTVTLGGESWKIQGNWSNAAANTNSGYGNTVGCIETG